jgi:hypothetical protein
VGAAQFNRQGNCSYSTIIAPKFGKWRIRLTVTNKPIAQKAQIMTKLGFVTIAMVLCHADFTASIWRLAGSANG